MKHQFSQKIIPRFQDADTEVRYVSNGFIRYSNNGRIARRGAKKGAWVNLKGTLSIPNRYLPQGTNKNLGCCSNKSGTFLVFLNWNSNDESGIYIYNPTLDEPLQLLMKDEPDNIILGFHQYFNIKGTKAGIINDKYFTWTDKYNAPRMIDLDWALDYKKKKVWEIQQVDTDITNFNVLIFKFNGVSVSLFTNNNGTLLLSNPKLYDYFDVDDCDCSITLTEKVSGTCDITTVSTQIRIVSQNFYPKPHNERQIDLVLYPPSTAPTIVLRRDRKIKRNFLSGNTWQFRYQYVYKDGNYSVWSAWSKSINTSGGCAKQYNVIDIDYTDKIFDCLNDTTQLHLIDRVVLGYRNTNTGELYSFISIKQCDIPKIKQTYSFYNDISASAVSTYNDLKQYDTVPLQCGTLNSVNNRILTGGVTENYDEGKCFDFDVDVLYNTEQSNQFNGKIECDIHIRSFSNGDYLMPIMQLQEESETSYWGGVVMNPPGFSNPISINKTKEELDLFDQRLARRGFTGYIAGTDISALSVQANTSLRKIGNSNIIKVVTGGDFGNLRTILEDTPNKFIQRLTFDGLADGEYIIRLASHWCWKDNDVLGKGEAYNMDNGLQYQRTSTNIYAINGDINAREIRVVIQNGIQQGSNPIIEVEDTTRTIDRILPGENMTLIQGYLVDERDSDQSKIYSGIRVEKCATGMYALTPTLGHETDGKYYTLTDHNGYFYGRFEANINSPGVQNKFKILATKDRNRNWNVLPGFTGEPAFVWNDDTILKGNLSELKQGTCSSVTNNSYHIDSGQVTNFVVYNVRPNGDNITNNFRTLIKGKIVDADGNGISGVTVVATETERHDKTDDNGDFSILLYTNLAENRADKRSVRLIAFGNSCFTGFVVRDFTITLGATQYNNTNPYLAGNIIIQITDNDIKSIYYLKNGDTYNIGVTLMDRALRKTTVICNEKKHTIRLPFTTEYIQDYFPNITTDTSGNAITPTTKANGFFTLKIKPKSIPTIWQTHLYTLRTEGQVYADYIQFVVSEVKYVINYDTTTVDGVTTPDPVFTTFAANDANEIYLDMVTSFVQYKDRNSNSVKGWTVEKGDRLRFIYKKDGGLRDFIEVEVKEQRGRYFVIPVIESLDEILKGEVVEIFRLKTKLEKNNFYETGEYIKVLKPYTDTRSFALSELLLNTGDAYRRNRKMYALSSEDGATAITVTRRIEDMTPNDTVLEKDNDRGRLDFINDFYKQVHRQATIRFGDTVLLDSNLNNIRRFNAEQEVTADYNNGEINIIDSFDNLLFVAQESKCHTRLIGKTTAYLSDGQKLQFDADSFLAKPYYLNDALGCKNPESYSMVENSGIFFDSSVGIVAKYSPQNGLINISGYDDRYKTSKYQDSIFIPLSQKLNPIPKYLYSYVAQVNGVFNDFEKEYNISVLPVNIAQGDNISSFSGTRLNSNIGEDDAKFKIFTTSPVGVQIDGFTMTHDNEMGFWFGYRSYNPETYGTIKNKYFGFVNGIMHEMENGDKYNNFFGVQYKSAVWVMMNVNPSDMKFFTNWSVESDGKWSNPYVKVDNSRAFRNIESSTPDAMIVQKDGVFYSAFCFDINTPNIQNPLINGNKLCGETLIMHLENSSDTEVILFAVNIYAGYIFRSNF